MPGWSRKIAGVERMRLSSSSWTRASSTRTATSMYSRSAPRPQPGVKDAGHELVIHGKKEAVNPREIGTKAAAYSRLQVPAGKQASVRLRLCAESEAPHKPIGQEFDQTFEERIQEADEFYTAKIPAGPSQEERRVARQGYAGLLWSKQFFHYSIKDLL